MKPRKAQRGAVLIEFLTGTMTWILILAGTGLLLLLWWGKAFARTETYYLARAKLYQNAPRDCSPSSLVDSRRLLRREYVCRGLAVDLRLPLGNQLYHSRLKLAGW